MMPSKTSPDQMRPSAYYNEHDRFAAAWLRELIKDGLILAGDVDERDIRDVRPIELVGYTQCHFFAGIGGWPYAMRLAGWPDELPAWTGSCPCQPFSAAGKRAGLADERHLWPALFHLISVSRPPAFFGEQVASEDGLAWLDIVHPDLESAGYAVGPADLCAAGVGAFHIRQRLWILAHARHASGLSHGTEAPSLLGDDGKASTVADERLRCGVEGTAHVSLGDADSEGCRERSKRNGDAHTKREIQQRADASRSDIRLGDARGTRLPARQLGELSGSHRDDQGRAVEQSGRSPWADVEWIACHDGKARPTQPGLLPLAHGIPNRVGTLRGAGNAINPQTAAEVIAAFMDHNGIEACFGQ